MKIRMQRHDDERGWRDGCEREVTERGKRSVRADDPEGYTRTFSLVDGSIWHSGARLRIHPDDVPGLMSLPVRGEKPKPLDLNRHPAADVLREVVALCPRDYGDEDRAYTLLLRARAKLDHALIDFAEGDEPGARVGAVDVAADLLTGLAALADQKGGA